LHALLIIIFGGWVFQQIIGIPVGSNCKLFSSVFVWIGGSQRNTRS